MSLIDVYTDRNEPAGYRREKKEAHQKGLWHRVFTCLVIHTEHQTAYLQRKAPGRYRFERPDYMDVTVGGHYEAGERIEDGVREIQEEIGIAPAFSDLVSLGQRQTAAVLAENYDNREFQHIFLLPTTKALSDFSFQDDEVTSLVGVPLTEGLELMRGTLESLQVNAVFRGNMSEPRPITITQKDFVPIYLKTDEFMIRLFIAAQRYLRGEDPKFLYW